MKLQDVAMKRVFAKYFHTASALIALGVTTTFFIGQNIRSRELSWALIRTGTQTCFSRVTQSFTAKMIGDLNSQFLKNPFLLGTEECFGEVLHLMGEAKNTALELIFKKTHRMASDVNWFHKKIETSGMEDIAMLPKRYERLEGKFMEVAAGLNQNIKLLGLSFRRTGLFMAIFLTLFFLLYSAGWIYRNRARKYLLGMDSMAKKELEKEGVLSSSKVEEIVLKVMDVRGGDFCRELFMRYHSDVLSGKLNIFTRSKEEGKPEILDLRESVCLDKTVSKIIERYSTSFFKLGVILDVEIDEHLWVKGSEESLLQVFFNLCKNSLDACEKVRCNRKIRIFSKSVGSTVIVEFMDTGAGFPQEIIDKPLYQLKKDNVLGVGLGVCLELMDDDLGEISLLNHYGEDGEALGARVKLVLEKAEAQEVPVKKVKNLFVGSKKEILGKLTHDLQDESRAKGPLHEAVARPQFKSIDS